MSTDSRPLTARLALPDLIVRGQDHVLRCPLYRDAALQAPSSGTVSVYDASGTARVDGQAVTVTGDVATYTVQAATTSPLIPAMGWRVEWALVVDGETHLVRNDGALVRRELYPVVTDVDLQRRVAALDGTSTQRLHRRSDLQDVIDEAWTAIQLRLIERGDRPNLIISPTALRAVHMALSLAYAMESVGGGHQDLYLEQSRRYYEEYEAAWQRMSFVYDQGDDGEADDPERRHGAPTVWLSATRGGRWR